MHQFQDTKQGENELRAGSDAPILDPSDPRSPENIERRRALKLIERDEKGRVLPGSYIPAGPGRPKGETITTLARTYTERAVAILGETMEDTKAPPAAKVAAAQALLDRGWGKAPIQIDLNVRMKFDDFLRDVGIAATYEHEHPQGAQTAGQTALNAAIEGAIEDVGPDEAPQDAA
jgi:hypothetical protein